MALLDVWTGMVGGRAGNHSPFRGGDWKLCVQ